MCQSPHLTQVIYTVGLTPSFNINNLRCIVHDIKNNLLICHSFFSRPSLSLPLQHFKVCKETGIRQQNDIGSGTLSATSIPHILLLDLQSSVGVFLLPTGVQRPSGFVSYESSPNPSCGAVFPPVLFPVSTQPGHENPCCSGQVQYESCESPCRYMIMYLRVRE